MRRLLTVLALTFGTAASAVASYPNYHVNADGYTWWNGNWYWGNDAYARTLVTRPGYYSCGVYYPASSYYRYAYSHTYRAPAKQVSYTDPGWRSKLLDIAAARDRAEGEVRKSAFEQVWFLEAVKALGLQGNFRWDGYGAAPPYPAAHQHYGAVNAVGGSTVYGYSYQSVANLYGDGNINALYQQAQRLTENAQKLAGQATTDFSTLVGAEGQSRAKVAEILAKGQAVQEMLRAIEGSSARVESKTFSFKVVPGADGKMEVKPVDPGAATAPAGESRALWLAHAKQKCDTCHGATKKEGGFDWTTYPDLGPEQKLKVVGRLLSPDEGKRMPRNPDGSPGVKLTTDEVRLWLLQ